ncbi:MAG: AMP-binding protein, partial [Acidimicrobiia bacterium]|nr:AMP-binding protein [Acidimicrobiia bacterium]
MNALDPDPTPSHTVGASEPPLLEETIGQNLARTVASHGTREALVVKHQDIRWTYRQYWNEIDRVARALVARGFTKGDRIGIWAPNVSEWALIQYATARIGVIQVSINPAYRTHEVAYVLNQSGCKGLVAATTFKTSDYRAMIGEVRGDVPSLEQVVFIGTSDWDDLLDAAEQVTSQEVAAIEAGLSPLDPINIQYTSGTTGFPKGATLSHRSILNDAALVGEACDYDQTDRVC